MRPACNRVASASWTWPLNISMWAKDDSLDGCSLMKLMYCTLGNWEEGGYDMQREKKRLWTRYYYNLVSLTHIFCGNPWSLVRFNLVCHSLCVCMCSGVGIPGSKTVFLIDWFIKWCSYLSNGSVSHLRCGQLPVGHCHASKTSPQRLVLQMGTENL